MATSANGVCGCFAPESRTITHTHTYSYIHFIVNNNELLLLRRAHTGNIIYLRAHFDFAIIAEKEDN